LIGGNFLFSPSIEKLEKKVKDLNAVKAEYRSDVDEAEKQVKRGEMDKAQFERLKERNEEHVERCNVKIRELMDKIHEEKKKK
jgi:hypothetical protein